jgi:hypothetical protein
MEYVRLLKRYTILRFCARNQLHINIQPFAFYLSLKFFLVICAQILHRHILRESAVITHPG